MQAPDPFVAKREVGRAMLQGCSWREAVQAAGVQMSRATAYRQRQRLLAGGEAAWHDRRQGHATKVRGAVRTWLEGYYQHHPRAPGSAVQALLEEQDGVRVSVTHLNRVRAALTGATRVGEKSAGGLAGWSWWTPLAGRRARDRPASNPGGGPAHPGERVHASPAGTGHSPNAAAVPAHVALSGGRWTSLVATGPQGAHESLLTLLFLGVVGLHRSWELRGYAQEGLALLTTRRRAYGYRTAERFLSQVAQAGGAESFTDALARWTTRLWKPGAEESQPTMPVSYLDGHRKPVFSDFLLPRGVIGRTGKVLGCRTLLLLHDEQGHPLLATTHRGDLHLTLGAPSLLTRYEAATDEVSLRRLVIDREGMAAEFLAKLAAEGRAVVTILRTEQYRGLASFTDVGAFLPLARDRAGQVTREVAPARFQLTLPEQPGHFLSLTVALIRDWRAQVPVPPTEEDRPTYRYPPSDAQGRAWYMEGWEPMPFPSTPTEPKLIPIVTTAPLADPVELAQLYRQRWPVQENILKDWLLPIGLDTNHGFAKTPVENSEVAKRREALKRRLANIQRWAPKARERKQHAAALAERLRQETKAHGDVLYRRINLYICEHDLGNEREWRLQHKPVVKAMEAEANADLAERWRRYERVRDRQEREASKYTRYCLDQCDLLRALKELAAKERAMYELENGKDQCMTVLKLALANLGMWVRDQYFPASYAHATWHRLLPFFRLPGRVTEGKQMVWVELRPFNDRQLNRDLRVVCERVTAAQPHLPDGRRLCFTISGTGRLSSDGQRCKVA